MISVLFWLDFGATSVVDKMGLFSNMSPVDATRKKSWGLEWRLMSILKRIVNVDTVKKNYKHFITLTLKNLANIRKCQCLQNERQNFKIFLKKTLWPFLISNVYLILKTYIKYFWIKWDICNMKMLYSKAYIKYL